MPNFALEKAAGGRVAGVDEVGRGPLAGPVVAAAVVFTAGVPRKLAALLDDSKKLTAGAARWPAFAGAARRPDAAEIAVGAASVAEIERLNILHAALLAMRRAVARLPALPDLALVDGNRPPALPCPVRCVVGGDGDQPVDRRRLDHRQGGARPARWRGWRCASRLRLGDQCRLRHRPPTAPRCAGSGPPPSPPCFRRARNSACAMRCAA